MLLSLFSATFFWSPLAWGSSAFPVLPCLGGFGLGAVSPSCVAFPAHLQPFSFVRRLPPRLLTSALPSHFLCYPTLHCVRLCLFKNVAKKEFDSFYIELPNTVRGRRNLIAPLTRQGALAVCNSTDAPGMEYPTAEVCHSVFL